jgi:unsaturated rhamnogalacturonyl hydrolase
MRKLLAVIRGVSVMGAHYSDTPKGYVDNFAVRYIAALFLVFSAPLLAAERRDIGLSQKGTHLEAFLVEGESEKAPLVVLVGGLEGAGATSIAVEREIARYEALSKNRRSFKLIAIPLANPERVPLQFPPAGIAYRENAESHVLWRWVGIHAPDLVVVAGSDFGLVQALTQNAVAGVGRISAMRLNATAGMLNAVTSALQMSQAHTEIDRRQERSPRQLADELAQVYGRDFDQLTYLPGMALIGQLRLGNIKEVVQLAERYLDGRDNLVRANSLTLAGHLLFAELAERTRDTRYVALVRKAADTGFTESGAMKESMPYHEEMSDSIFMTIPLLAKAGKLTGDPKYFDMAARHFKFMQKLVLRPDGLYRHSPLTDAAWGRGNAFPALGLALALSDFPTDHPAYDEMVSAFVQHMDKLVALQNEDGLWLQVVDHPGSYAEFSATAMIATAMLRGIRNGWLDARMSQPVVERAWHAVLSRVGTGGVLTDVCESTNKQRTLEDYLHRAAILDRDPRGGGMALIFATEMAGLQ